METSSTDPRHFQKSAAHISEASCSGRYMRVSIEKVLINVPITGNTWDGTIDRTFSLVRVLYSNLWDHPIDISHQQPKLIDSEGIQHTTDINDHWRFEKDATVRLSKKRSVPYSFESPAQTVEGRAKIRGWLFFPSLPPGIYPHRFVFTFWTFEPGFTTGRVQDHDTLEVVFSFQFRKLLPEARGFVTLEIE